MKINNDDHIVLKDEKHNIKFNIDGSPYSILVCLDCGENNLIMKENSDGIRYAQCSGSYCNSFFDYDSCIKEIQNIFAKNILLLSELDKLESK